MMTKDESDIRDAFVLALIAGHKASGEPVNDPHAFAKNTYAFANVLVAERRKLLNSEGTKQ